MWLNTEEASSAVFLCRFVRWHTSDAEPHLLVTCRARVAKVALRARADVRHRGPLLFVRVFKKVRNDRRWQPDASAHTEEHRTCIPNSNQQPCVTPCSLCPSWGSSSRSPPPATSRTVPGEGSARCQREPADRWGQQTSYFCWTPVDLFIMQTETKIVLIVMLNDKLMKEQNKHEVVNFEF